MSLHQMDFRTRATEKVKRLWHSYLVSQDIDQLQAEFDSLCENLLLIGTGRHELYKTREEFLAGILASQPEARQIQFELQDEWYDVQEVSESVCVVYGSIWAREKDTAGKAVLVDMEGSRFTVVCRDLGTDVEICSVHHSMPYIDQAANEYYPKTLVSLANEALLKNRVLEKRMELDHMTELYSRFYMERHVTNAMHSETGFLFILDLDNFKTVNDTKGHPMGDRVIQRFAGLLRHVNSANCLLGRMGGDEFAVWDTGLRDREEAELCFLRLLNGCRLLSQELGTTISCTAGVARYEGRDEDFASLYRRADLALYQAKRKGKACLCWAEPT